ncbi:signal recognition particle receptor subunit alpha, partial [Lactobacillus helveticus]
MGLFDRIKKSLFGKKDDEEEKKEEQEKQDEVEQEQEDSEATNQEEQPEENAESGEQEEETEPIKEDDESEASEEVAEDEEEPESEETTEIEEKQDAEPEPQESETTEEEETEEVEEDEDFSQEELYERGLEKTNKGFGARLNAFFAKFRTVDEDFFDDLEDLLIESDVGYETAEQLTDELREEAKLQNAKSRDDLKKVIVEKLVDLYDKDGNSEDEKLIYHPEDKPNVYLFVGVNGAGKTTTIGKLAKRFKD